MKIVSLSLAFDNQPELSVITTDRERRVFTLSDDQLWLLARQANKLVHEHYNLVRPESQT